MPNAKAAEAAALLKSKKAGGGILAAVPEPKTGDPGSLSPDADVTPETPEMPEPVAETGETAAPVIEPDSELGEGDAPIADPALIAEPLEPAEDLAPASPPPPALPTSIPQPLEEILAGVGELDKRVCREVGDDDVRGHLRDAVQSARQAIAIARSRGVWPTGRTLSLVIAIDPALDGHAQVFAGDRTAR
jgi:hypothetical protein